MANSSGPRPVHEVWRIRRSDGHVAYVAFIQHGSEEEGFEYEVVCPLCAKTLGFHEETVDAEGRLPISNEELMALCKAEMKLHRATPGACDGNVTRLGVVKTTRPLRTEKRKRIV